MSVLITIALSFAAALSDPLATWNMLIDFSFEKPAQAGSTAFYTIGTADV